MKKQSQTPKKKKINNSIIKVNLKKEKDLCEIANELQKVISNCKEDIDINKIKEELKNILLDIFSIINKKEKAQKINIKTEINTSQEKEKPQENINNSKNFEIVNLDKEEIKNTKIKIGSSKNLPTVIDSQIVEGTYTYKNNDKYEGQMIHYIPHGKGIMYYNNGLIYDGQWKNGKRHGKGIYILTKGKGDVYEGDFKDNEAEGKGISKYSNGDRYEGDYHN